MSVQGKSSEKPSSVLNNLRLGGEFCDAVIKVKDAEFKIHKVILCNCSQYFCALFSRWSDKSRRVFDVDDEDLSPQMMELIIDFAYTGSLSVTEENVQELTKAADKLSVLDVLQICFDYLAEQLCPKNCIGIWQFTNSYFSPELQQKANSYIIDHFEEVVSQEEFQTLTTAKELTDILDKDDLNVRKESNVYEAILHWIAYKPQERETHFAGLFSKVRLAQTSLEFIRANVMSNELVKHNTECLQIVGNVIQAMRSDSPSVVSVYNHLGRPRLPSVILLAIGGWSGGDPTNAIEVYNVRADCWINVTNNLERPRAYHSAAFLNGYVYCVGGFDRVEHFNTVRRFDLCTRTWHEAAPMHFRRCYVSTTVLNGCIYAMGGYDGQLRLSSAECYRPETNQWSVIASMHMQRSDASCTTLYDKVYICGGFNGIECLQSAEYYNPETNQWTMIAEMSSRRSGLGVIAYADHVYAVGGFNGNNRLHSAEAYNPLTNTWHFVPPMLTPRSNFGLEVIDDYLFVVGGFNGYNTTSNVEYYQASADEWGRASDMEIFRSALSCCVVRRPPNMSMYPVLTLFEDESEQSDDPM